MNGIFSVTESRHLTAKEYFHYYSLGLIEAPDYRFDHMFFSLESDLEDARLEVKEMRAYAVQLENDNEQFEIDLEMVRQKLAQIQKVL